MPTISKTRDAPPASMTDVASPWPTIVNALLLRSELLSTSSSLLTGYGRVYTSAMILVGSLFESAAATAASRPLAIGSG